MRAIIVYQVFLSYDVFTLTNYHIFPSTSLGRVIISKFLTIVPQNFAHFCNIFQFYRSGFPFYDTVTEMFDVCRAEEHAVRRVLGERRVADRIRRLVRPDLHVVVHRLPLRNPHDRRRHCVFIGHFLLHVHVGVRVTFLPLYEPSRVRSGGG